MRNSKVWLFLSSLIFAVPLTVDAASYLFYQGGFENGGYITGSFSGTDLNGDGQLKNIDNEFNDGNQFNKSIKFTFKGNAEFEGLNNMPISFHDYSCCVGIFNTTYDIATNQFINFIWTDELRTNAMGYINYHPLEKSVNLVYMVNLDSFFRKT